MYCLNGGGLETGLTHPILCVHPKNLNDQYDIRIFSFRQTKKPGLDPPSAEFAGDSRRRVRSRTNVLQVPANTEDPVKSADPKGHTVFKAPAANIEGKNRFTTTPAR